MHAVTYRLYRVHLIATLVLAELSYRLVEQPIRQVGVRLWGADVQQRVGRVGVAVGVVLGLLLVFGSAVGFATGEQRGASNST